MIPIRLNFVILSALLVTGTFSPVVLLGNPNSPAAGERAVAPLFRISRVEGHGQVRQPGETAFKPLQEGRAYPYGSIIDLPATATAVVRIGEEDRTTLSGGARVTVDYAEAPGAAPKVMRLERGNLSYEIPAAAGEANLFRVLTPMASIEHIRGAGLIQVGVEGDHLTLSLAPRTEGMRVFGSQFTLPALSAGNQARLIMSRDRHYLALRNLRGTYAIKIEEQREDAEPFSLTPQMVVKFWRRQAPAGGRMVVSGLISHPDGSIAQDFAFIEGAPSLPEATWEYEQQRPEPPRRGWRRLFRRRP